MSPRNLIQWSGLASILSGVLLFVFFMLNPARNLATIASNPYVAVHAVGTAATILGQLGIAGLYARQSEKAGVLGLFGFVVCFVGLALTSAEVFLDTYVLPLFVAQGTEVLLRLVSAGPLIPVSQLTSTLFVVGFILFGLATLRAGVLPRWAAVLVIVGSLYGVGRLPLPALGRAVVAAMFAVGLIWLGYALWSEKGETVTQPKPAM
jgi:hypothetical protein